MKICFKCGKEKDINDFYKHFAMADKHLNKCKECSKKDTQNNYHKNIEYYKIYEKERNQRKERKEKKLEYQKKIRKRNPEKYKARQIISNSLRNKQIIKEKCKICGSIKTEAHHQNYKDPFDIIWLCFKHHRLLHKGEIQIIDKGIL